MLVKVMILIYVAMINQIKIKTDKIVPKQRLDIGDKEENDVSKKVMIWKEKPLKVPQMITTYVNQILQKIWKKKKNQKVWLHTESKVML
jgi:hypothetical protein